MRRWLVIIAFLMAVGRVGGAKPSAAPGRIMEVEGVVKDGVLISDHGVFPVAEWVPPGAASAVVYENRRVRLIRWTPTREKNMYVLTYSFGNQGEYEEEYPDFDSATQRALGLLEAWWQIANQDGDIVELSE